MMRLFRILRPVLQVIAFAGCLALSIFLVWLCSLSLENSVGMYPALFIASGAALTVAIFHGLMLFLAIEDYSQRQEDTSPMRHLRPTKVVGLIGSLSGDFKNAAGLYWNNMVSGESELDSDEQSIGRVDRVRRTH